MFSVEDIPVVLQSAFSLKVTTIESSQNGSEDRYLYKMNIIMNNNFLMPKSRVIISTDFPGGSVVKNPPANAGDVDSIPGFERSPGEGNGNPLHCSCLENPLDRGTRWATVQWIH